MRCSRALRRPRLVEITIGWAKGNKAPEFPEVIIGTDVLSLHSRCCTNRPNYPNRSGMELALHAPRSQASLVNDTAYGGASSILTSFNNSSRLLR